MSDDRPQRRVVCAAIRASDGSLVLGIRHYSMDMHAQLAARADRLRFQHLGGLDQGFVDQYGVYMTRAEAYLIAQAAGQLLRPEACSDDAEGDSEMRLFSEALY